MAPVRLRPALAPGRGVTDRAEDGQDVPLPAPAATLVPRRTLLHGRVGALREANPRGTPLDRQGVGAADRTAELKLPHAPEAAAPAYHRLLKARGDARGGL